MQSRVISACFVPAYVFHTSDRSSVAPVLRETGGAFVVDDLVSWLIERLADAGYRKVSTRLRGSEQERVLRQAVTAAVRATAAEFSPSDEAQADQLATRISGAFSKRALVRLPPNHLTRLEALRAGVARQLSVLENSGTSTTARLGVPASVVADRLTAHLLSEISARGSGGGPSAPLANQISHDLTHSKLDELQDSVDRLPGRRSSNLKSTLRSTPAGWWEEFRDDLSVNYQQFIGLENEASSITIWHGDILPGLLQTEAYARYVIRNYARFEPTPPAKIERLVRIRMRRQQLLTRGDLAVSAVLDESVLKRRVGDESVIYEQLQRLAREADRPNVTLQILPMLAEHSAAGDSFTIFGFWDDGEGQRRMW
jgi:hypothetical protein